MIFPRSTAPSSGTSFLRSLTWGVVVFDLLIVAFAAWTLFQSRHQLVDRAEAATQNLAQVLEQNVMGLVNQIDLVLLAVKDEAERKAPDSERRLQATIEAQNPRIKVLDALRVTDARGVVQQGTGIKKPAPGSGVSDRDYFKHLEGHPEAGLYVSQPVISRFTGNWILVLARRLNKANGAFAGVVYATIPLDRLGQLFSRMDVGEKGSISLRGGNLELLVRYPKYPGLEKLTGDRTIDGEYLDAVQSGRTVSHFTTISRLDDEARTYTFSRTSKPTFYILVGLARGEYLRPWRQEVLRTTLGVTGLLAFSFGITWIARRAWDRLIEGQVERDRLIQELTQALVEVKQLRGMLPICGQCKKIRDDRGYWNQMEAYLSEHTEATFSHGVCPDCAGDLRREIQTRREQREASGQVQVIPPKL